MIKKLAVIFLINISFSYAINIQVFPDKNISIEEKDILALKKYMKNILNFRISEEGAVNITRENRVLANKYLEKYGLKDIDKSYILIQAERYLADQFVRRFQREKKIDDKIALSYYLEHKNEFKKPDKVQSTIFIFRSAKDAIGFYNKMKNQENDYALLKKMAFDFNASIQEIDYKNVEELKQPAKAFVVQSKKSYCMLPPFIFNPRYAVIFYVREYKVGEGFQSFDEVKKLIKEKLYYKSFSKFRNELLRRYGLEVR